MEGQRVTTVASVGQNDVNPEQMAASHQGYDVFLCHAGENKAFVRQLVERLEKDGLKKERIFYDEISLQPGDELDSIIKVIESPSLKLFVFVVSKYCFQSNKTWIRAEWEAALENNKQIFPIWLDDNNDGFKAFGNLVREFSYKLRKIIAQRVNLQEVSTSLDGLSEKICSLVFGDRQSKQRPQPSSNVGPSLARQNFMPDILPAKLKLEFVQKSYNQLLDKAEALFDDDTLKDEDRLKEADKIFLRFKARIESIIPQGCFILNLRFFQPCNVDEFYHDHFRLGPASLSAALTRLFVTDKMRAAAGGEELMVRVEVRYDDYIRVRRQLCMTGILKTSSVDDLPTVVRPRTERRLMRSDLEGMDLAIAISEDSGFTEWVSHPGTRHLAKKARQKSSQVTALERRLEIGQHRGGELVNMFFRFSQKVTQTVEVEALATLTGLDANEINGSEGKHKTNQSYQANNVLLKWMEKDREASMDKLQQRLSDIGLDQLAQEAGRIKAERLKWPAEAGGPLARRPAAGGSSDEGHQEIRQVEQKLVQMQHHSETQEAMVRSLQAEVTRLRDKEGQAQKVLLDHKLEIQQLQQANVVMETRMNDLLQDNEKLRSQVVLPGDGGAAAGPRGIEDVRRHFFFIKENVSVHWRDLAHFLGFTASDIVNIQYKQANCDAKDCCMDMLEQWRTRRGNAATLQVLLQALTEAGLQDTVDQLNTM